MLTDPMNGLRGRRRGTPTVVGLHGDLDWPGAASANARLDALTAGSGADLVLDLSRVRFLDCAGVGVLCRARRRVRERGGRLTLVITEPHFGWILRTLGLGEYFEVLDAPPEGTRQAEPRTVASPPAEPGTAAPRPAGSRRDGTRPNAARPGGSRRLAGR